jgi:transposase
MYNKILKLSWTISTLQNKILKIMSRGTWENIVNNKVKSSGRRLRIIDWRNTSRKCSICRTIDKKARNGRIYHCKTCWHKRDTDINASTNVFNRFVE